MKRGSMKQYEPFVFKGEGKADKSMKLSDITEVCPVTFYPVGGAESMTFDKVSIRSLTKAAWSSPEYPNNTCVTIWDGEGEEWLINYSNVYAANIHHKKGSRKKDEQSGNAAAQD